MKENINPLSLYSSQRPTPPPLPPLGPLSSPAQGASAPLLSPSASAEARPALSPSFTLGHLAQRLSPMAQPTAVDAKADLQTQRANTRFKR